MTDIVRSHDTGINALADAGGVVESADGESVSFDWDEQHVVTVDAPADLKGAFDTDKFYKITDAVVARPIKQRYIKDGELVTMVKAADELRKAAWSFDNSPYTIGHPNTGMVKDVNDIHGFWRNVQYDTDDAEMVANLYIPVTDDEAVNYIEENKDVSVGFYNREAAIDSYDGDLGPLVEDTSDVDGVQTDILGNHIAGVERGRCSGEDGCGLDDASHGVIENTDSMTDEYSIVGDSSVDFTTDYTDDEGQYFAVAPDENPDDEPKFPINSCSDVGDAWHFAIRERGDIDISFGTLKERIQSKASNLDCDVPSEDESDDGETDSSCGCGTTQTMDEDFKLPQASIDALAEENDKVAQLIEERDEYESALDERRERIDDAFDSAENFDIDLDDDECRCDGVKQIVEDLDEQIDEVEDLRDELSEYREDEIEEKLDELEEFGADREEMREMADDADDPISELDSELERWETIAENVDDSTVKNSESGTESTPDTTVESSGTRSYGRGHGA